MKAIELIQRLQDHLAQDLELVFGSCEDGFDPATGLLYKNKRDTRR